MALSYRKATIKFTFDAQYTRPKAHEIERFMRDVVKLDQRELIGIHLSIVSSVVYVKLIDEAACDRLIRRSTDGYRFCHADGNVGVVSVDHAGLGVRTVRVFELPFEVPADMVIDAFRPYGTVLNHAAEKWTSFETYPVLNGVRQIRIELRKHIPSYVSIGGCRAIVIYDGQPRTCSGCGQEGHVRSDCLQRRLVQLPRDSQQPPQQMTSLPITYVEALRNDVGDVPDRPLPIESTSFAPDPTSLTAQTNLQHHQPDAPQQLRSQDPSTLPSTPSSDMEADPQEDLVELHPSVDVEERQRKQRSPKKRKKRRLSTADEQHKRGAEQDSTTDQDSLPPSGKDEVTPTASVLQAVEELQPQGEAMEITMQPDGNPSVSTRDERPSTASVPITPLGDWAQEMDQSDEMQGVDVQPLNPSDTESGGNFVHGGQ